MKLAGIAIVLVGGGLIALAAPRVASSILALPGDSVLDDIGNGRAVDVRAVDLLIASRRSMLTVVESSTARSDLGFALILRARYADPGDVGVLLEDAVKQLNTAVRAAPANMRAWTRLAYALAASEGPSSAAAAMHMAIMAGPNEGRPVEPIFLARLRVALAVFGYLADDDRKAVMRQLRVGWQGNRQEIINLTYQLKAQKLLREALPEAKAELDELRM